MINTSVFWLNYQNFYFTLWGTITLLLIDTTPLHSQSIFFSSNQHYGSILRHSPNFRAPINGASIGSELRLEKKSDGTKLWEEVLGKPTYGATFSFFDLGDINIFGRAYGLYGHMTFDWLRLKRWHFYSTAGMGIGYVSNPYHPARNPINDVLGARFNVLLAVQTGITFKINDNWNIRSGGSFTHYSSAASKQPNLGINVGAAMLGFYYRFCTTPNDQNAPKIFDKQLNKLWGGEIHGGFAWRSHETSGGPRYPVYALSMAISKHTHPINKLLLGIDIEFNTAVYGFLKHVGRFEEGNARFWNASRLMLYFGDELSFGRFTLTGALGVYLSRSYLQVFPIYNKTMIRYYLDKRKKVFISISVKTHLSIAEYIAFGGGIAF